MMIHKKGFTLIEMVLVFIVMGVMLGLFLTGSNVVSSAKDRKELLRIQKIKNAVSIARLSTSTGNLRDILGYDNATLSSLGYKLDYMHTMGLLTKSDLLLESPLLQTTPETYRQRFAIIPCEFLPSTSDNLTDPDKKVLTTFFDINNDSILIKDACLQIHINDFNPLAVSYQTAMLAEVPGALGVIEHIMCLYEKAYDDKDTRAGSGRLATRDANTGGAIAIENIYKSNKDCSFGTNSNYYYIML